MASYKPNPDVVSRNLGNETILVHLHTNQIYSLNGTATRFWELMIEGNAIDEIQRTLLDEYEVEEGQLLQETQRLLSGLKDAQMIVSE